MSTATSRPRIQRVSILLAALAIVVAACGSEDGDRSSNGSTGTTIDVAAARAYVEPGPYSVGATTLQLDGRKVEVWYPAGEIPNDAQQVIFEIRDLLPENLKSVVPDDLNPRYPTNAYRDVQPSADGPFPLVLFAHGFSAYPTEYQFLLTHLASWGMVVAGPDFSERGLLAALTGSVSTTDETELMQQTKDLLQRTSDASGGCSC